MAISLQLLCSDVYAQGATKRVLFIGNSYTYVNDLPKLISELAFAQGDSFIYESSTPGGYTLEAHSTNATTLSKIRKGNWDFVVLQEQSQRPSFPQSQVQVEVYPYANFLDSAILASNPCAETVFYMTWGRKNGDASNCAFWPPICTYRGMDSLLRYSYTQMAIQNKAVISPVGPLWNHLVKNNFSSDLYSPDQSHPSLAGSYTAACSFYMAFFRRDLAGNSFNSTLNALVADTIRQAAKLIVFDSLSRWYIGTYDLIADFDTVQRSAFTYSFINKSINHNRQLWDFGFTTDTNSNPSISFPGPGFFPIILTIYSDCDSTIYTDTLHIMPSSNKEEFEQSLKLFPNPARDEIRLVTYGTAIKSYVIYTLDGAVIRNEKYKNQSTIRTDILASGFYLIEILTEQGVPIKRTFLINRD